MMRNIAVIGFMAILLCSCRCANQPRIDRLRYDVDTLWQLFKPVPIPAKSEPSTLIVDITGSRAPTHTRRVRLARDARHIMSIQVEDGARFSIGKFYFMMMGGEPSLIAIGGVE